MNRTIKLTRKQARPFLAFLPDYTGRKITAELTETVNLYNLNWDGGSKNEYTFLAMEGGKACPLPQEIAPWENPFEGQDVSLPVGFLILCRTWYCGQDCGVTIFVNPDQVPAWLPAKGG